MVSSLLKRWTAGTLHYRLSYQHMPYYLDEFTFRFNRRNSRARGMLFYRLLQQAVDTPEGFDRRLSVNCTQAEMQEVEPNKRSETHPLP